MVLRKLKVINWTMCFYIGKGKICFKKRLKRTKNLEVQNITASQKMEETTGKL